MCVCGGGGGGDQGIRLQVLYTLTFEKNMGMFGSLYSLGN